MNDQKRNSRTPKTTRGISGIREEGRKLKEDAVHPENGRSSGSEPLVNNSPKGPLVDSVGLRGEGLENLEFQPTSKDTQLRLLPFLKDGTTFLEIPKMYDGESAVNAEGIVFRAMERGWFSTDYVSGVRGSVRYPGGPVGVKTDLDLALGLRYNSGKVRFGLIPAHWTRALAQILTVGAQKYAPRNWEKGLVHSEVLDSLYRHLDAFLGGERYDSETKCHHLGHVAWNALALMTFDLKKVGKNDLEPDGELITREK